MFIETQLPTTTKLAGHQFLLVSIQFQRTTKTGRGGGEDKGSDGSIRGKPDLYFSAPVSTTNPSLAARKIHLLLLVVFSKTSVIDKVLVGARCGFSARYLRATRSCGQNFADARRGFPAR